VYLIGDIKLLTNTQSVIFYVRIFYSENRQAYGQIESWNTIIQIDPTRQLHASFKTVLLLVNWSIHI